MLSRILRIQALPASTGDCVMRHLPLALATTVFTGLIAFGVYAQSNASTTVRAQLVARQFTTLSSELPAQVETINVREGKSFKAGQVLVALDCSVQQAQLAEARAAVTAAEKKRAVNQRLVELNAGGKLEADLAAAEADQAAAKLRLAQAIVSKCTIRAPFSGRVVTQAARAHQYVQAGQPLLEILDNSALDVEFIAPSNWLAWMKPGHAFAVVITETGKSYPAQLIRVGAKVDAVSHSIKAVGRIQGAAPELVAGMSGRVVIKPANRQS